MHKSLSILTTKEPRAAWIRPALALLGALLLAASLVVVGRADGGGFPTSTPTPSLTPTFTLVPTFTPLPTLTQVPLQAIPKAGPTQIPQAPALLFATPTPVPAPARLSPLLLLGALAIALILVIMVSIAILLSRRTVT